MNKKEIKFGKMYYRVENNLSPYYRVPIYWSNEEKKEIWTLRVEDGQWKPYGLDWFLELFNEVGTGWKR